MGMSEPRAWSLLSIEGTRQYGGNTGYDDDPGRVYRYDSGVPNHLQLQPGDIVFVRSGKDVLGFAEIERIDQATGEKERLRCPVCRTTNIKARTSRLPRWGCKERHLFDEPIREMVSVTTYAAWYGDSFSPASGLELGHLNEAVLRPSDQMSIKEIDVGRIERLLSGDASGSSLARRFAARIRVGDGRTDRPATDGGSVIEARRRVLREIAVRRGQAAFRDRLIRRHGTVCQVSRCVFTGLIEAAHIRPYATSGDNGAANGLLLRSDLHTLFDLGLLGIDPKSLTIHFHPELHSAGYGAFEGRELFNGGSSRPDREALKERWVFFGSRLASPAAASA
jgi:hypothetical protein